MGLVHHKKSPLCAAGAAVQMYNRAGGSVSNLEVAVHEIATYNSLGHVEGTAHMLDHRLDEAAGMACMVQK